MQSYSPDPRQTELDYLRHENLWNNQVSHINNNHAVDSPSTSGTGSAWLFTLLMFIAICWLFSGSKSKSTAQSARGAQDAAVPPSAALEE